MPTAAAPPEPSADAIYRAWRSARVDPDLAYEATEQIRAQAGRSVITVVESRFVEFGARIDVMESRFAEFGARIDVMESRFAEFGARIDVQGARIDALTDRIDTLQKVLWPMVVAVCITLLSAVGGGLFALFRS